MNVTVTNMSTTSQTVTLKNSATLIGGGLEKTFTDQVVIVAANSSQTVTLANVSWNNAKYWWPDDPKLYEISTSLIQGTTTIDSYNTKFGFRQFNVSSNYFQLNGVKTNLRGDALQYHWHKGSAHGSTASASQSYGNASILQAKKQVDEWKATNMNVAKTHIGGDINKALYDYADQIWLMIIDETPFWQYGGSNTTISMNNITEWVNSRKNHPSIIIWSGGNENWSNECSTYLIPTVKSAIQSIDTSRPITQDAVSTSDEENEHYTGGYPASYLNNASMYVYNNNLTKPRVKGEAFTPSGGWASLNPDGTLAAVSGTKDCNNDNIVSQAVWHRATLRMQRAMRYAGFADIRYYANWIYSYEPIEDTIYPVWPDLTASGVKPTILNRPVFNVFDSTHPTFIKSDSYEYAKNTFSPVAAFDKNGDKNNRIGVDTPVFTAGSIQTRTIVVYNDEQLNGTSINVSWEAGYTNPADGSYTSFQTASFPMVVPYGGKVEQSISFTLPSGISNRWLQLKLTAQKGSVIKFQETNQIAAIGSIPPAKIYVSPTVDVGTKNLGNVNQLHAIKLINKGGSLSTTWTSMGQGGWLTLNKTLGNLRGEQEIYFTINTAGLVRIRVIVKH